MNTLIAEAQNLLKNLTVGENGETAFLSTGDKSMDLFGTINRGGEISNLVSKFEAAWNENPELAIKVILNFRDVREGKGEKLIGKVLIFLLKLTQPDVYTQLLPTFVEVGCWKDIMFLVELTTNYCKELEKIGIKSHYNSMYNSMYNISEIKLLGDQLKIDSTVERPSLCAKWAPTEGCHYDKKTNLATSLMTYMGFRPKEYRKMLTELRAKIRLVETQLSQNKFQEINFSTIPSRAHLMYKKAFLRDSNAEGTTVAARTELHARYIKYLEDLKAGQTKANFKGIMPHELVAEILKGGEGQELIENQWKSIRENIENVSIFDRCLSIVDVSSSMESAGGMGPRPIDVAIALGILVSECSKGIFKHKVITFHEHPTIVNLSNFKTLASKVHECKSMPWGGSTDMEAVFDEILKIGSFANLTQEQMPDKLFIFTDMQFNQVSGRHLKTFDKIEAKYKKHGYKMPQIICWNLRTVASVAFTKDDEGVCLLSGFSTEIMKAFLTCETLTPMSVFLAAIGHYKVPLDVKSLKQVNFSIVNVKMLETAVEHSDLNFKDHDDPKVKAWEEKKALAQTRPVRGAFSGRGRGRGRGR